MLDENLDVWQRRKLERWGIRFRRVGGNIGRFGMDDYDEIIRCYFTPFGVRLSSHAIKIFTGDG